MNYIKGTVENISKNGIRKKCRLEDSEDVIEGVFIETVITLKDKDGEYKSLVINKDIEAISCGDFVYIFYDGNEVKHIYNNKKSIKNAVNNLLNNQKSPQEEFDYSLSVENVVATILAILVMNGLFLLVESSFFMVLMSAFIGIKQAMLLCSSDNVIITAFIINLIIILLAILPESKEKRSEREKKNLELKAIIDDIENDYKEDVKVYHKEEA